MLQRLFALGGLMLAACFASTVSAAEAAPDWQLQRLGGDQTMALSALRGQVVLVDFWASWCVPCRGSMAALQTLQQEFADQAVRIVPISVDADEQDAQDFLSKYGAGLVSLHDPEGEVAEAYDLLGMPSSFVIGPSGELLLRHEGYRAGDEDLWRDTIKKALPGS